MPDTGVTSDTILRFPRGVSLGRPRARPPVSSGDERVTDMSEFQHEIAIRLESASQSLEQAQAEGDDYLAQVRLGEIESLQRLAQEHDAVA